MQVYLIGSPSALAQNEPLYRRIMDIVSRQGADIVTDIFSDQKSHPRFFSRVKAHIRKCDLVIAEVSQYTQSMGYEVANALEQEKPVYCFRNPAIEVSLKKPLPKNTLITVVVYTPESLEEKIAQVLEKASAGTVEKFTFSISPSQQKYLTWVEKNTKQTRSEYLKKLIDMDIKNSPSYSQKS